MARNNTGSVLQFMALGVITIAGGAAIGYFVMGGMHPNGPVVSAPSIQESSSSLNPAPAQAPVHHTRPLIRANGDYTASGAPRIRIVEDKTPTTGPSHARATHPADVAADTTDIPTPDSEASQEAGRSVVPSLDTTPRTPAPKSASDVTSSSKNTTAPSSSDKTNSAPNKTAAPDKDFERVTPATDSEASQSGDASSPSSGKAQYRVQAGSFADSKNARDYVNSLHEQGVAADMHSERQGEHTIYKVQVGAYRNRAAADEAAADLRNKGVSVTISPVKP